MADIIFVGYQEGFTLQAAFRRLTDGHYWQGAAWAASALWHPMAWDAEMKQYVLSESSPTLIIPTAPCRYAIHRDDGIGVEADIFVPELRSGGLALEATAQEILGIVAIFETGGLNPITVQIRDAETGTDPVPGLTVEIWNLAGSLRLKRGETNTGGLWLTSSLPAGDYLLRGYGQSYTFEDQTIEVLEGGGTVSTNKAGTPLLASRIAVTPAIYPALCNLYGWTADIKGVVVSGAEIEIASDYPNAVFGIGSGGAPADAAISKDKAKVYTDPSGFFSVGIVKGIPVRIKCSKVGYNRSVTIADAVDTLNWKDIT
jgi:hypothetical protein